jgi:hypothetical protein
MKTKHAVLVVVCLIIFFACKKSDPPSTTNNNSSTPPPTASMTASYAGGTYSVTNAAFTNHLSNTVAGPNNNIWGSYVVSSTTVTIGIVASFTTTGVYPLTTIGAGQINGVGGNYETGYPMSNPGVGTLTVTTYDTNTHLMAGTFSFTAGNGGNAPAFSVTNGSFSNLSF